MKIIYKKRFGSDFADLSQNLNLNGDALPELKTKKNRKSLVSQKDRKRIENG